MSYAPENLADCLADITDALDMTEFAISEILENYNFPEQPKIMPMNTKDPAFIWLWDYPRIIKFMLIAIDYLSKAREAAEQATATEKRCLDAVTE